MLTLFNQCKDKGEFSKALVVGRNLFNRHPESEEVFSAYFDFLCTLAESLPSDTDRKQFAERADMTLAFFEENAAISEELLEQITVCRQRLDIIFTNLHKQQNDVVLAEQKKMEQENQKRLLKIHELKGRISSAADQAALDNALAQLAKIDAELEKDSFTVEQSAYYNTETRAFTELISDTMRRLEYKKNVAYNKKAAESFSKAYKAFCEDEGKYKNKDQLRALASKYLFSFDAARLFNETLIYYNHIYSYIFSKLDEDGKFALTKCSIECERKQR